MTGKIKNEIAAASATPRNDTATRQDRQGDPKKHTFREFGHLGGEK